MRVSAVTNMSNGKAVAFTQMDDGIYVTLDQPAPCGAFGGEWVAEVFEMKLDK
jgi:hypothetical protein